jgi:hypothetical protein
MLRIEKALIDGPALAAYDQVAPVRESQARCRNGDTQVGYSTTLYAVDLNELSSAVGSGSATLLARVRSTIDPEDGATGTVDPTKGPRVKLTLSSEIYLNGERVTWDEFKVGLSDPKWKGTYLYQFQEDGKRTGVFSRPGSFVTAIGEAIAADPAFARAWRQTIGTIVCDSEEELLAGWEDVEELPAEQALAELISGQFSRPDCSYGYALEELCQTLGTRLATLGGKNRLKALKLDTPLSRTCLPVPLPEVDEFPFISYLSAEDVQKEAERLRALDLSYPRSAIIESERRLLLQGLETAAERRMGVVAFYY